jgi:hypothetical protein
LDNRRCGLGEKSGELHFTKPFGRARHYIGWSPDINRRVSRHKEGKGAKFTMGALRHGADLLLVRIWPGGDRRLEWELKHKGTHQALCPLCSPLPARLESPCLLATRLQREGLTTTVREPERVCASDIAKKLDRQKPRNIRWSRQTLSDDIFIRRILGHKLLPGAPPPSRSARSHKDLYIKMSGAASQGPLLSGESFRPKRMNAVRLVASASSGVGLGFTANASFRRALCP